MDLPVDARLIGDLLDRHGAALEFYASQWTHSPEDCVQEALVDMREALRLEMTNGLRMFPVLLDVETAEHSPKEWARLIVEGTKDFESIGAGSIAGDYSLAQKEALRGIAVASMSMLMYPHAKERLLQSGMEAEQIEQMPVGQVLLIDAAREYQRTADEFEKWLYVPYPIAKERMRHAEREMYTKATNCREATGDCSQVCSSPEFSRPVPPKSAQNCEWLPCGWSKR